MTFELIDKNGTRLACEDCHRVRIRIHRGSKKCEACWREMRARLNESRQIIEDIRRARECREAARVG